MVQLYQLLKRFDEPDQVMVALKCHTRTNGIDRVSLRLEHEERLVLTLK